MKPIILSLCLAVFAFAKAYSQKIEGIATYQSQRHVEMKMDSTSGLSKDFQESIQEQLRKQFQKTYKLTFDVSESLWRENRTLEKPQAPNNGDFVITVPNSNDERYTNVTGKTFTEQSELMGKQFLIEDQLKKLDWKLEKEIKNIGQYTCFKATLTEEIENYDMKDEGEEVTIKTKVTTAWYTLDIPVQLGPDRYWGLPGLILEVNDGKRAMMCTQVILNPADGVEIKIPTKGKKVNATAFEKIAKEKTKEMLERYQTKGKKGQSTMTINISG